MSLWTVPESKLWPLDKAVRTGTYVCCLEWRAFGNPLLERTGHIHTTALDPNFLCDACDMMWHPSGLRTYIYKIILFLIQHVQNNDECNASHERIVHADIICLKFWDIAWGHIVCKTCWCSVGDLSWLVGTEVGMVYTLTIWPNYSVTQTCHLRKKEDMQLFLSKKM